MIAQFKKTAPVFIAVLILCLLVTMPPLFAKIKEKTLLDRVVTEEIPENVLTENSKKTLSVSEKLDLIVNGRSGGFGVAVVDGIISGVENDNILKERACLELEKLMKKDAILVFDTSDCELISGTPLNYVNLNDMSQSVSLIWINFQFASMMADVLMDVETSQIYEYNLYWDSYSVSEDSDLVELDNLIRNFEEYTGLSEEEFDYFYNCSDAPMYIGLR